jgi:hypothetical protein
LRQNLKYALYYEDIKPKNKYRGVWYLDQELSYKALVRDFWQFIKFWSIKLLLFKGSQEIILACLLVLGFSIRPVPVHAQPLKTPPTVEVTYLKAIPRLKPVRPLEIVVPDEVTYIDPPVPQPAPTPPPVAYSGSCASWMAEAGVPATYSAQALIDGESGCSTSALNTSSGACGIPQELPCNKSGCGGVGGDPVCQLKWMDGYVKSVYGSWDSAYSTWLSRSPHWY